MSEPQQAPITIQIKRLDNKAQIPQYQTAGAAGFDLRARVDSTIVIQPGETRKVPTGLAVNIGLPMVALYLMARSGLAAKGISLGNGVGLVDSDYQGELGVLLRNGSNFPFTVCDGDRIAQGVFGPVFRFYFEEVEEFAVKTERGAGGFGSTGNA